MQETAIIISFAFAFLLAEKALQKYRQSKD